MGEQDHSRAIVMPGSANPESLPTIPARLPVNHKGPPQLVTMSLPAECEVGFLRSEGPFQGPIKDQHKPALSPADEGSGRADRKIGCLVSIQISRSQSHSQLGTRIIPVQLGTRLVHLHRSIERSHPQPNLTHAYTACAPWSPENQIRVAIIIHILCQECTAQGRLRTAKSHPRPT